MPLGVRYPPNSDQITPYDTQLLDFELKNVARALMEQQGGADNAQNAQMMLERLQANPALAATTAEGENYIRQNFASRNPQLEHTPELDRLIAQLQAQGAVPNGGAIPDAALGLEASQGSINVGPIPQSDGAAREQEVANQVTAAKALQSSVPVGSVQQPNNASPITVPNAVIDNTIPDENLGLVDLTTMLSSGAGGAILGEALRRHLASQSGGRFSSPAETGTSLAPSQQPLEGELLRANQLEGPRAANQGQAVLPPPSNDVRATYVGPPSQLPAQGAQPVPNDVPNYLSLESGGPAFPDLPPQRPNPVQGIIDALGIPSPSQPQVPQAQAAQSTIPAQPPTNRTADLINLLGVPQPQQSQTQAQPQPVAEDVAPETLDDPREVATPERPQAVNPQGKTVRNLKVTDADGGQNLQTIIQRRYLGKDFLAQLENGKVVIYGKEVGKPLLVVSDLQSFFDNMNALSGNERADVGEARLDEEVTNIARDKANTDVKKARARNARSASRVAGAVR